MGLAATARTAVPAPKAVVISTLGITQILAWGSSYYLPAVLAQPIADDTGRPPGAIIGGLSLALLVSGLVSPRVGRLIDRHGGRPVLATSALLLAVGLACLALATSLPLYLGAWLVIGVGMGAGLYDPAFATLGRLYGREGRSAITALTLWGGFASTACWPLSALLVEQLGWRGACWTYAALHLGVALPAYLVFLPREGETPSRDASSPPAAADPISSDGRKRPVPRLFLLLALTITVASVLSSVMSVHLLTVLQLQGATLAGAVALGALVGPAQVAARVIEMVVARFHHPIWTKIVSTLSVTAGLALLWLGVAPLALALILYGAGIGLESIARGTLPLAIFGPERYGTLMGRIALGSLAAQAAAPVIAALLLNRMGAAAMLAALIAIGFANLVGVGLLWAMIRRR